MGELNDPTLAYSHATFVKTAGPVQTKFVGVGSRPPNGI
jgi:hypothetical protein